MADRLGAGRAAVGGREVGDAGGLLAAGVALFRAELTAQGAAGGAQDDSPQPGGQLGDGAAAELGEAAVRLQQRVLDQIGAVQPARRRSSRKARTRTRTYGR